MIRKNITLWTVFITASVILTAGILWYTKEIEKKITEMHKTVLTQNEKMLEEMKEGKKTLEPEEIDTSDWKTYRNEKYGFEVKYPNTWKVTEGYTAIIGLPVDCSRPSNESFCNNFSLVFAYDDGKKYAVSMQTSGSINEDVGNDFSDMNETYSGIKYGDSISLNEEFGACFRTATFPLNTLKKGIRFWFFTFYEVNDETLQWRDGDVCGGRQTDPFFNGIVKSLKIFK